MGDLKGRSVRGGAVTLTSQAIKFGLQLGSTMVLARLLTPSDFGLIAMVTAIAGFAATFKDAGLSMATVQSETITHDQVSTLFWINVGISAVVMLILAAMAPFIATLYSEQRLTWVTVGVAITSLFGGFTVQHQALLKRQMRFNSLAFIEIVSISVGISVAIILAVLDFGFWSLVGMSAATALANAVMVWVLCDWRPGMPRRGCGAGAMVKFGGGLTVAAFFNHIREQGPFVIIGWTFGPAILAMYEKAYRLLLMPLRQMMPPISSVAIPVLCRVQEHESKFRSIVNKLLFISAFFSIAPATMIVPLAPEIVSFLLGPQWHGAGTIFAFLAPLAATQAISNVMVWCITTQGKSTVLLKFSLINSVIAVTTVAFGACFGIEYAALAFSVGGLLIRTPMLYYFSVKNTPVTWRDLFEHTAPFVIFGTCVAAVGVLLRVNLLGFENRSFAWAFAWTAGSAVCWTSLGLVFRVHEKIIAIITEKSI